MIRSTAFSFSALLLTLAASATAQAGTPECMRTTNIFSGKVQEYNQPVSLTSGDSCDPLNLERDKKIKLAREAAAKLASEKERATEAAAIEKAKEPNLSTPDGIVAKYGSPDQKPKVLGTKDAPPPIQAAHLAMEAGDYMLAARYMKQARLYFDGVKKRAGELAAMESMAGDAINGVDPKENLVDDEQKALYDKLKPVLDHFKDVETTKELSEEDIAMLEKARLEKDEPAVGEDGEIDLRKQTRKELAGKVPRDPNGLVNVYFFFTPGDDDSVRLMLAQMNQLKVNMEPTKRVRVEAFSTLKLSGEDRKHIAQAFKLSMPVFNGRDLAERFGLKRFPAVLFEAASTHQTHVEYGYQAYERSDEIIRLMRGDT